VYPSLLVAADRMDIAPSPGVIWHYKFEEGVRDAPTLKRKGAHHVQRVQRVVVETTRREIGAE